MPRWSRACPTLNLRRFIDRILKAGAWTVRASFARPSTVDLRGKARSPTRDGTWRVCAAPLIGQSIWSVVVSYIIFGIGAVAAAAVVAMWSYKRLTAGRTRGGRRW
jgi:hypothetical protein